MNYKINISSDAEKDIAEAIDYIDFSLKNQSAANNLMDCIEKEISNLSSNPYISQLVDDPVLHTWGIRFITIKNYLVFYTIDEDNETVNIVRFLYGKRNWTHILRKDV